MSIKDELKKVFNPELVDSAGRKLKEINESEASRKIKSAAKNAGRQFSNKLDELAENPPDVSAIHISPEVKKKAARGINGIVSIAAIILGIWLGVMVAGFIGGVFRMIF